MTHRVLAGALAASLTLPLLAAAVDQPISARKLIIKRSASGSEKLVFVSKDPAFLVPTVGSADDPATGSPGGAMLDLVTETGGHSTLDAPAGIGNPGWRVKSGAVDVFKFVDTADGVLSALRVVLFKETKVLKVVAKTTGLALDGPLGAASVRVTTGSLRSCARFDAQTIRKDEAGRYVAKEASAGALGDCSDASIGLSPCGDSAPVCDGTCPTGETCASLGPIGPFDSCACLPTGVTPCSGSEFGTCGGECPVGGPGCGSFSSPNPAIGDFCACGSCGASGPCPPGFTCGDLGGGSLSCVPIFCIGGSYPTCGGTCPTGLACGAFQLSDAAFAGCLCGAPASCDETCGGWVCGAGEVCVADIALSSCGCQ